jgi:hypothetical protein
VKKQSQQTLFYIETKHLRSEVTGGSQHFLLLIERVYAAANTVKSHNCMTHSASATSSEDVYFLFLNGNARMIQIVMYMVGSLVLSVYTQRVWNDVLDNGYL